MVVKKISGLCIAAHGTADNLSLAKNHGSAQAKTDNTLNRKTSPYTQSNEIRNSSNGIGLKLFRSIPCEASSGSLNDGARWRVKIGRIGSFLKKKKDHIQTIVKKVEIY